ncbi:hypothetical protein ACH5RR_032989 [Cinchona calisaya]|uniref:BTB domain-containing protein n=1 Tax=Cinchona calisaya TaxID=153742 RepID=A0ABD2YMU7_9GENT
MSSFPDRVLRLEIMPDSADKWSNAQGNQHVADKSNNCKHRREDSIEKIPLDATAFAEERILHYEEPDTENDVGYGSQNEGEKTRHEAAMYCSGTVKVTKLHISTDLLAKRSPFFSKLFSNGMRESRKRYVTICINASEEAAFLELLNFMQTNTLPNTTVPALLDILTIADKFEVISCMNYCSNLLQNMPITLEYALQYLQLPSSIQIAEAFNPLVDAAKHFLAACYKDTKKYKDEIRCLPLAGIEAILLSDDLQVASEDALYDLVMEWAKIHYPKLEERREILTTRLGRYIRFPYMTFRKLKRILFCNDFEPEFASRVVLEALIFKSEAPEHQRSLVAGEHNSKSRSFVERAYRYRPVKVVEFDIPHQQCVVYLDLKREECQNLYPARRVYSQAFHLAGQVFFLTACCNIDENSSFHHFGLFLGMQEKSIMTLEINYEFAARSKLTKEFISKYKGHSTFIGGKAVGVRNLFGIPWSSFMAEDSLYFMDNLLHLRAEITINH